MSAMTTTRPPPPPPTSTQTPYDYDDDDYELSGIDKLLKPEAGLPISIELFIIILCGATFVLGTIAIAVCCTCCYKKKRKKTKRPVRQQQNPAVVVIPTNTLPHNANQPVFLVGGPKQQQVVIAHAGQAMAQAGHPGYQNAQPGPGGFPAQPGLNQPPQAQGQVQGHGKPAQNNNVKRDKTDLYKPANLENRRSVKDNKYIQIQVPPPSNTDTSKSFSDTLKTDDKLDAVAKYISRSIAKMLEAITIDNSKLVKKDVLGSGQFGVVFRGELSHEEKGGKTCTDVALKTIAGDAGEDKEWQEFIDEVMRMKHFNHKNVMPMLGMTFMDDKPYMVLPFMPNGDLKSYISNPTRNLNVEDLLNMSHQVVQGMAYLSSQHIIHADLAARNVMVDNDRVVKVADFGLSRHLFTSDYYSLEKSDAMRPVRWMAVECLQDGKFTTKSDVWSFGILLWEIMTRGQKPYPDIKQNTDVMDRLLNDGYRMPCPEYTADEIYDMMNMCWREDPNNRPSFSDLCEMFGVMLSGGNYEKPVTSL